MNPFGKITPLRSPIAINLAERHPASACDECGARHIGLCDALSDEELGFLFRAAQHMSIPPGKLLMEEGGPAQHYFNVNSGMVRLFKALPDGRRQIIGFAGPGHFIGLALTEVNVVSAEAMEPVQVCRFSRAGLSAMAADYPALERKLLDIAVHELALGQQQMLLLGRKTALERTASFLLSWAQRQEPCGDGGLPRPNAKLILPLARADLADYLGLTIETVSRSLGHLKKDGLIEITKIHEIILLRPKALAEVAEAAD
ncbi:Crp/Fnr family transcriptional regulator [Acidocella sp.]|uniref:Crp/Fnr family transcriptional regulator n=1 Tax=Acidocella sp. TaxID=50710 RepID=UPI002637A01F|nr:helix-turn-helix domain-containing protein [Acidocella sp.]